MLRLADFLERRGIDRVDFLKADIEGGELNLLRGAENLISRCRPRILMRSSTSIAIALVSPLRKSFNSSPTVDIAAATSRRMVSCRPSRKVIRQTATSTSSRNTDADALPAWLAEEVACLAHLGRLRVRVEELLTHLHHDGVIVDGVGIALKEIPFVPRQLHVGAATDSHPAGHITAYALPELGAELLTGPFLAIAGQKQKPGSASFMRALND